MKPFPLLLIVLLLAGALYLLLGGDGDGPSHGDIGPDLLDAPPASGGPLLTDDGEPEAGRTGAGSRTLTDSTPADDGPALRPLTLRGRVVDERRRPVAEAKITVRIGRRSAGSATSAANGRYEIPLANQRTLRALVAAETEDGRKGTASVWTTYGVRGGLTVPTIVVKAVTELRVRVLHGGDREAVGGATCVIARRSAGAPVVLGTHRTSATGELTVGRLPRGPVEIFASFPGRGRGHTRVTLPQAAGQVAEVALGGERRIEVTVIDAATRRPVEGAEILVGDRLSMPVPDGPGYLPPVGSIRTNASGRATVSGLGAGDKIFVNARAPGYVLMPWWKHASGGLDPGRDEIQIALQGYRTVRFLTDAFAPETPADGTPLTLELDPQTARMAGPDHRAWLEGGALVVAGLPVSAVRGIVRAPEGLYASFSAPARVEFGPDVVFRRDRTVVVWLVTHDRDPAPGVRLALHASPAGLRPLTATTDDDGRATFQSVGGESATVHRARSDGHGAGVLLAKLDLTEDTPEYEVTLRRRTNMLVRVTVNGESRLPSEYTLTIAGRPVVAEDIVEDPAAGTLLAPFDNEGPRRDVKVRLVADGYLPAEHGLSVEGGDVEHEIAFDLAAAGELVARVTPPTDAQYGLSLEVRDDATGTWGHAPAVTGSGFQPFVGTGTSQETRRFGGLAAGTYRVRDPRSGVASKAVAVVPGAAPATVALDLSSVGWVEGLVAAPAGVALTGARVLVEGKDKLGTAWAGAPVKADGTFRVRAGGSRSTTLTVTHPTLRAAKNGGRATVRPGETGVTLRLERGGEAFFRVGAGNEATAPAGMGAGSVTVRIYKGKLTGEPLRVVRPVLEAGTYRFGGVEPGTYTLWIDIGSRHAPVVKRNVRIGDDPKDLGTLEPDAGSTLRVRLRRPDRDTRLYVTAVRRDDGPAYTRSAASSEPGGEAVCSGLGKGLYQVQVRAAGALGGGDTGVLHEEEIRLDGRSDKVIEVAAR